MPAGCPAQLGRGLLGGLPWPASVKTPRAWQRWLCPVWWHCPFLWLEDTAFSRPREEVHILKPVSLLCHTCSSQLVNVPDAADVPDVSIFEFFFNL